MGAGVSLPAAAAEGRPLRVVFKNVSPPTGKIWLSLCSEQELPKRDEGKCSGHAQIEASEGASHVFTGASAGVYVVTAYHDDNDNGALDFDTRGIPAEATGNSGNAVGSYGPPTFDQMKFELSPGADELVLTIFMRRIGE
jgi:uncharacterized protein (DUF2141 family)